MSALLDEDTSTATLEGLDFSIPCAFADDHAAEVFARCRRCKGGAFLCRHHFEAVRDQALEKLAARPTVLFCAHCEASTRAFDVLFEAVDI